MARQPQSSRKCRASETGVPVVVRLQPDALAKLDAWRRRQTDMPTRPEALRRMAGLTSAKGWMVIDADDNVIFESDDPQLCSQFAEALPYPQRDGSSVGRGWDIVSSPMPE